MSAEKKDSTARLYRLQAEVLDCIAMLYEEARSADHIPAEYRKRDMPDEYVLASMAGHPYLDKGNRPEGWTDRDLVQWARGYLYAEGVQGRNASSTLKWIGRNLKSALRQANAEEGGSK